MATTEDKFSRFKREHNLDPAVDFGGSGADLSNYYTKAQTNSLLAAKTDQTASDALDTRLDFVETHVVEVAYNASITLNAALGSHFRITLTGNTTINAPTNLKEGQRLLLEFVNSDGGAKTVTMNSIFKFSSSVYSSIEISSSAGAVDYYGGVANKEATAIRMIARAQGF